VSKELILYVPVSADYFGIMPKIEEFRPFSSSKDLIFSNQILWKSFFLPYFISAVLIIVHIFFFLIYRYELSIQPKFNKQNYYGIFGILVIIIFMFFIFLFDDYQFSRLNRREEFATVMNIIDYTNWQINIYLFIMGPMIILLQTMMFVALNIKKAVK
jgi:hypothetical protein